MHIKSYCQTLTPNFLNTSSAYHVEKKSSCGIER